MLIYLNYPEKFPKKVKNNTASHPGSLSIERMQWLERCMGQIYDLFPSLAATDGEKSLLVSSEVALEKPVVPNPANFARFSGPISLKLAYPLLSSINEERKFLLIHLYDGQKDSWKNLLWKMIFKGIDVVEFILLDELLKKRWDSLSPENKSLLTVIFFLSTSTRKGLISLKSKLRPIKGRIPDKISNDFYPGIPLTRFLKIPEKGRNVSFFVQYKSIQQKEIPSNFKIGKGYTDQGGISPVSHLSIEILKGYQVPQSGGKFDREFFSILQQMKEKYFTT